MFYRTVLCADRRSHMGWPPPPWLVGRASDRHAAERDQFKAAELEYSRFVRLLKAFQNDIHHCCASFAPKKVWLFAIAGCSLRPLLQHRTLVRSRIALVRLARHPGAGILRRSRVHAEIPHEQVDLLFVQ